MSSRAGRLPAAGNTSSIRPSSPRRRSTTGRARRSSARAASCSGSARSTARLTSARALRSSEALQVPGVRLDAGRERARRLPAERLGDRGLGDLLRVVDVLLYFLEIEIGAAEVPARVFVAARKLQIE